MANAPVTMLDEMAVFAQVVDSGSFSAAARRLSMQTSSVSRHVSRLEQQLGGRLLQRSTRSLALTELGREVHAACRRMTAAAQEVHALGDRYGEQPTGTVRLSAPVVFGQTWLAQRLPAFLERHPSVDVQLTLTDDRVDLIDGGVDVALRISRELAPGLAARPVCDIEMVLVASPAYLATHSELRRPEQLAAHRVIYLDDSIEAGCWSLRQGDATVRICPSARVTANNSAAIVAMVLAQGGIGLVPDFAAAASLAAGRTTRVLAHWLVEAPAVGKVHIVYTPGRHLPLKVRALINHLTAGLDASRPSVVEAR